MSETKNSTPIWAAPAVVTEIGEGDDGHDVVGLRMYGETAMLPVNLPSEARLIGAHLGRRVTVALLAATEGETSPEEQLVWHRGEIDRLRELLAAKPTGEAEARVEIGRATVVVTLRSAAAEEALATKAAEMLADEHVARRIAEANSVAAAANKNAEVLAMMMRHALLIIDAVAEAEQYGMVRVSTTSGAGWDELRRFAADPEVRKWLLDNTKDHAHVEAVGGEDDGDEKGANG